MEWICKLNGVGARSTSENSARRKVENGHMKARPPTTGTWMLIDQLWPRVIKKTGAGNDQWVNYFLPSV
jgi:hypothetical protein